MKTQTQIELQHTIKAFQNGNIDEAILILQGILQKDTKSTDTVFELGIAYAKANRFIEALNIFYCLQPYKKLDERVPYNLGLIHSILGNHKLALEAYDLALKIKPNDAEALVNKGSTYNDIKNYVLALEILECVIKIRPDIPVAWFNKGLALNNLNSYQESINSYNEAIKLSPNYYEAWSNKSIPLNKLKFHEEALLACNEALSLKPDYAEGWSNKGNTLHELKRYDEAIAHYDKALSLKPDYVEGWYNKGVTLQQLRHFDKAIAHYDKAFALKPDYYDALWNKSFCLLLQGDFENGFQLYESRWQLDKVGEIVKKQFFDKPMWLGAEPLNDKTILLYGEQGLGDFIQFCRYVKLVKDLGANVILEVPQSLAGLMKGLNGITKLVIKGEDLPFFDYQCPLLSLPLAFKTNLDTIPSPSGYINLNNYSNKIMEWKVRLGSNLKPRVGLVWSGNPHHKNDHNRSILLSDIIPFLPNQCEYVSLQKEVREVDKLTLDSNPHILNFASYLNDFLDTAALIDNLDLVISVDTSVAHLSGTLEKKHYYCCPMYQIGDGF